MRHITTYTPPSGIPGIADTTWQRHGACYAMDIEDADAVFFPTPRDYEAIAESKELCGWCPVRDQCLNFALENELIDGTWGGLTEGERRPLHKKIASRRDLARVLAVFQGREVHLTAAERDLMIDLAYIRGWSPARLAVALRIGTKHARDLLRRVEVKITDRDRHLGIPEKKSRPKAASPRSSRPPTTSAPRVLAPTTTSAPAHAALGKAA
ncbi:WhiB family transcriptional regulator [Streptomyces sp. GZWMJZ-114]|uniref:WhiB family transcriptional regulator n=1 Tax=Streptomyces sp. GZWMJZ-114 TaxID=2494734 RepID=UPI001011E649|nr:WhiB family transcriptional regulator [Streptomyces sp. GZWMJZ-114]